MNLLLLLSVFLSALGGAVSGVRGGPAPAAICTVAQMRSHPVARVRQATRRPLVALPRLIAVAAMAKVATIIVAAIPAYASRRRE